MRSLLPARRRFPLDERLLQLSPDDYWTLRDACEGTQVFGAPGSGKSSGRGATIARAMLRAGFGGIVLASKKEEAEIWQRYCLNSGRANSLLRVSLDSGHYFDFLRYECNRPGTNAGSAETLVPLLLTIVKAADQDEAGSGNGSDPYWHRALKELLLHTVELGRLIAGRELSLDLLAEIVATAPHSPAAVQGERWQEVMASADQRAVGRLAKRNLRHLRRYFNHDFPGLPDRTRGSITSMFTSTVAEISHGIFGEMFTSGRVNLVPELTHEGAVIVLDIPVNEHGPAARYAQIIFKYLWQQATGRRHGGDELRPVFLWSDEAQDLVTANDAAFQAKARSARACTVYLTQSIPSYTKTLGPAATNALLGNLQTKIFHANGDPETNAWAERLFGHETRARHSRSETKGRFVSESETTGTSESREPRIEAAEFTMLRKGGAGDVEAIVFQAGRAWNASGTNYLRTRFPQEGAR